MIVHRVYPWIVLIAPQDCLHVRARHFHDGMKANAKKNAPCFHTSVFQSWRIDATASSFGANLTINRMPTSTRYPTDIAHCFHSIRHTVWHAKRWPLRKKITAQTTNHKTENSKVNMKPNETTLQTPNWNQRLIVMFETAPEHHQFSHWKNGKTQGAAHAPECSHVEHFCEFLWKKNCLNTFVHFPAVTVPAHWLWNLKWGRV